MFMRSFLVSCIKRSCTYHGATRVWSQVLQWSSIWSCGRYNNGVTDGIAVSQTFYNLSYGWSLLTDSNINTVQFLWFFCTIIETFLVDDCVNGQSSFTIFDWIETKIKLFNFVEHKNSRNLIKLKYL